MRYVSIATSDSQNPTTRKKIKTKTLILPFKAFKNQHNNQGMFTLDKDDAVFALDPISGNFTRHHALTEAQIKAVRDLLK